MWMMKDDPPTAVVSVNFGSMPMYSARVRVEKPAGQQAVHVLDRQPRVLQGVVRRLGVVLKRRLVLYLAYLVRLGDADDRN